MPSLKPLLLAFCRWCDASFFGHGIRDSTWLFPFVEIFHLLALALLGGTLLIINMSLLGIRFRTVPVAGLARDVRPWMTAAIMVMLISGFLLFSTEAVKMYGNWAFQLKMTLLLLALLYTFSIHRTVSLAEESRFSNLWRRLAALASIALWVGVALGGRAIGYVTTPPSAVGH